MIKGQVGQKNQQRNQQTDSPEGGQAPGLAPALMCGQSWHQFVWLRPRRPNASYEDYNYYFRDGFRRGYDDGYDSRNRYGNCSNGKYSILLAIAGMILDLIVD